MLWLKAFHIIFVVTWFAGLFYLPRLFVYHVATTEQAGLARFVLMERRLYIIMSVGALLAVTFGLAMLILAPAYLQDGWLRAKLLLVAGLIAYHLVARPHVRPARRAAQACAALVPPLQ